MKKYPNVSLKLLMRYKNKVLILKEKNGAFSFPDGRIKWGESLLDALNRELKEEIGYSLEKLPEVFGVWNYISKNRSGTLC